MLVVEKKEFTTDFYGFEYKGNTEELIDANVYLLGSWATDELEFMKMVTDVTKGKATKVLDIGANVGTHSMFISKYAGEVHAIEPWPPVLERLRAFVADNNVTNVTVHPVGYAAENGSMLYHEPDPDNPGTGSFSNTRFPSQTKVVELPLVVGDEHLKQAGVTGIDIIKIDIEGYEKPALRGLKETIKRDRPTVLIELNVSNDEGIKSKEDLTSLFPGDYQYLELLKKSHRRTYPWFGEQSLLCYCNKKPYTLTEFKMEFDKNGPMVIAAPPEHASAFY
jgi:FkbM family methyltransferase